MKRFSEILKLIAPFLLLLLGFCLDGVVKYNLDFLNDKSNNGLPQFMLMMLIIFAFKFTMSKEIVIYAAIFGLFYDIFYMNIFGIYVVLLPLFVALIYILKDILADNFIIEVSLYLLSLIGIHVIVYLLGLIFKTVSLSFADFITYTIAPTVIFNLVTFIILLLPISWVTDKIIEFRRGY
ncbi:rod shape-determining protein MreD [Companilactobacillus sp. DQM5]|uniref:rod shape-determining protein MreD n=1 Tax=Companilactobacillus sp. DQM5 TaxID=3463359 RepID=UPI0040583F33